MVSLPKGLASQICKLYLFNDEELSASAEKYLEKMYSVIHMLSHEIENHVIFSTSSVKTILYSIAELFNRNISALYV